MFVLDASVAASWAFPDEGSPSAAQALELLAKDSATVPTLFWFELRNILVVNERRGRIREASTRAFLHDMALLPIRIDPVLDEDEVMRMARTYRLTVYDASYLELASRCKAPLATLDHQLARACALEDVTTL